MSNLIRYPLIGGLALFLVACGSSGSQKLLSSNSDGSSNGGSNPYSEIEYLLKDSDAITAAREKFTDEDEDTTDAKAPSETAVELTNRRGTIVRLGTRYLTTGSLVVQTPDDGSSVTSTRKAVVPTGCMDGGGAREASCTFPEDAFREQVLFHLGSTSLSGEKNVGFRGFSADRQAVMDYRRVSLSQVRTMGTDRKPKKEGSDFVYKGNGKEYVLTQEQIDRGDVSEVTEDRDGVALPNDFVLKFSDLTRVTIDSKYEYVGYDGILSYSMFFVGAYRFFDDGDKESDPTLLHQRFENASLGLIYDSNTSTSDHDNPTVSLTGEGVMTGMESDNDSLANYLVQGDVTISYVYDSNEPNDQTVSINIMDIKRLNDDGGSWFSSETFDWDDVDVVNSKFTDPTDNLVGSFYGTGDNYEVGGVFYREINNDGDKTLVGAFGSRLEEQ